MNKSRSPRNFTRRDFIKTAGICLGVMAGGPLISSCAQEMTATPQISATENLAVPTSPKPIIITYMEHDDREGDIAGLKAVKDAYEKLHPNVTIEYQMIGWNQAYTSVVAMTEAGTLPDCGRMMWAEENVAKGVAVPLDQYITSDLIDSLYPIGLDLSIVKDKDGTKKYFAIPYAVFAELYLYNKTFFDQVGGTVPDSPEAFLELASKLSKPPDKYAMNWNLGGTSYGTMIELSRMEIEMFGGRLTKTPYKDAWDPESIIRNSPETVKGMQWLLDMYYNEYVPPEATTMTESDAMTAFFRGRVAITRDGPYELANYANTLKGNGWELGVMEHMPVNGQRRGFAKAAVHGIFTTCKNPEVAFDFLRFMSTEGQLIRLKPGGFPPASKAAGSDSFFQQEIYKPFLNQVANGDCIWPRFLLQYKDLLDAQFQKIWQGAMAKEYGAEESVSKMQEIVEKTMKG